MGWLRWLEGEGSSSLPATPNFLHYFLRGPLAWSVGGRSGLVGRMTGPRDATGTPSTWPLGRTTFAVPLRRPRRGRAAGPSRSVTEAGDPGPRRAGRVPPPPARRAGPDDGLLA